MIEPCLYVCVCVFAVVTYFRQVSRLENVHFGNAVVLGRRLEPVSVESIIEIPLRLLIDN